MNPVAIHAFNPGPITGDGNWTWLVPGRTPTLIDAGTGDPRHLDGLEQALSDAAKAACYEQDARSTELQLGSGSRLAQVLVTHAHIDHASGAPAIAGRLPGVRFLKHPWPERDAKWPVTWEPIADLQVIPAGDTSLMAIHTPGHAPDHLCFWHEETRTLFSGDLAVKGTTVFIPSSLGGDLGEYLASLQRVLALQPARLLPAHGPVIEEPEELLRGYIAHRLEREEQVIDALRRGDTTPEAVVARVYNDLKDSLLPLAKESVLAHLLKLERDGRVRREGNRWAV